MYIGSCSSQKPWVEKSIYKKIPEVACKSTWTYAKLCVYAHQVLYVLNVLLRGRWFSFAWFTSQIQLHVQRKLTSSSCRIGKLCNLPQHPSNYKASTGWTNVIYLAIYNYWLGQHNIVYTASTGSTQKLALVRYNTLYWGINARTWTICMLLKNIYMHQ